jgi:pimeloyl-ACP methyl ester carboxylesterase
MIPKLLGPSSVKTKPELATRIRGIIESNDPSGIIIDSMAMADRPDSTFLLAQITCPTLVIVGEEDQPTPPAESRLIAQAIPGATLAVIPGAGHLSNAEQPEQFNEVVGKFLDGLGEKSSAR